MLRRCTSALLFPALFVIAVSASATNQSPALSSKFGQILIGEYVLSEVEVARFNAHSPSAPTPGESPLINLALADTAEWFAPAQSFDPRSNPYTLVITLTGTALTDGQVGSMWQSGWRFPDGTREYKLFPGPGKSGTKTGESVNLVAQSVATTFTQERTLAPALALVSLNNMKLDGVTVHVWAGVGESGWFEGVTSFYWLWIGLILLALRWWWRS